MGSSRGLLLGLRIPQPAHEQFQDLDSFYLGTCWFISRTEERQGAAVLQLLEQDDKTELHVIRSSHRHWVLLNLMTISTPEVTCPSR